MRVNRLIEDIVVAIHKQEKVLPPSEVVDILITVLASFAQHHAQDKNTALATIWLLADRIEKAYQIDEEDKKEAN